MKDINYSITKSLLEQDLYKFTMGSVYFDKFANCTCQFAFKDRTNKIHADDWFMANLDHQLDELCKLRFTGEELDWLFNLRFLQSKSGYKEFLKGFQFDRNHIRTHSDHGILDIVTDEASVLEISMFEIFVLSIVNEIYSKRYMEENNISPVLSKIKSDTVDQLKEAGFSFMEFGIRRRLSSDYQEYLVQSLKSVPNCVGTSNVYLAKKFNMRPMGTMAHEYLCLCQALKTVPISQSQKFAFRTWAEHYEGDLGIALSDNLGTEKFLRDFGMYEAKLFDGLRHDSGNPYQWAEQMIKMYVDFGIDPKSKTLCFSDGLSIKAAKELYDAFKDKVKFTAGIGTSLTNPICPTEIVMKMVTANGRPVAKLSNNPGKTMCTDENYVKYLRYAIENF